MMIFINQTEIEPISTSTSVVVPDNQQSNNIIQVCRSYLVSKAPNQFSESQCSSLSAILDSTFIPKSYEQASSIPAWMEAMESEIQALQGNDTWDLVSPTPNASIIGSKWVYSIKLKSHGAIDRYKARLVAQGYKQEYEIDYEESLALVAKMNTTGFL